MPEPTTLQEALASETDELAAEQEEAARIAAGLPLVRRRRLFLWLVIGIYLPVMWLTVELTHSFQRTAPVFAVWFVCLFASAFYSALVRCPRCGNHFHMHGMTLLYYRRCLHCQLHINADKQ